MAVQIQQLKSWAFYLLFLLSLQKEVCISFGDGWNETAYTRLQEALQL